MSERYDNADQLRERLGGISKSALQRYVKTPDFPKPIILGRRRFWPHSAIEAFMSAKFEQAQHVPE